MSADVVSALIAALVGGALGSLITAWSSIALARSARREKAAESLWNYHHAITAYIAHRMAPFRDEHISLVDGDFTTISSAAKAAYPYAGHLTTTARERLFTMTDVYVGYPPYGGADDELEIVNSLSGLSLLLERELMWAFPRRFGDRYRAWKLGRKESAK